MLLAASLGAHAGRPLSSDDASVAEAGTCQLESWLERTGTRRALVLAPACAIAAGLELDADYTLLQPRDAVRAQAGLALKLAPSAWRVESRAGELNFGLKAHLQYVRPTGAGWRGAETSLLGLASLQASEAWTVHANLGVARERISRTTALVHNLALVWTPMEPLLLFAESQANTRRDVFGATTSSAGARWWLVKDSLGLDLTASRQHTAGTPTLWSLGLGWYGLAR